MTPSINRRLLLWLAIPLTALMAFSSIADYYININEEISRNERNLNRALDLLCSIVKTQNSFALLDKNDLLPVLPLASGAIKYSIRDQQQQLIAGEPTLPVNHINDGSMRRFRTVVTLDQIYLQMLTQQVGTTRGTLTITVGQAVDTSWSSAKLGLTGKLLWDFILLDIILVMTWISVRIGLRPLRNLRDQIAGRSPSDLRPLQRTSEPPELVPLIDTLNRLFSLVRSSIDNQKQLVANTAHQLRTPMTGIHAELELLLADKRSEPIQSQLIALQNGADQMSRSINQLLALARADAASTMLARNQPVNLQTLVNEIVSRFVDRAISTHRYIGTETTPVWISADKILLDDLLSNLVDNALKYTKAGGAVTIRTDIKADQPWLEVDDSGIGIPASEYQQVRKRYYRSPNSPGHGTGLGLAIVDEITRFYGGTLIIAPGSTGQGTCITILFPEWMTCHP